MPEDNKGHRFSRYVAPFAPLALALAMTPSVIPSLTPQPAAERLKEMDVPDTVTAVRCEDNIADFKECHENYPTGCSASAGYDAYLNLLKNRTMPASDPVRYLTQHDYDDLEKQTPDGLKRTNHADFKDQLSQLGEGQIVGLIGYLYYFQKTGAESSNCQLSSNDAEGSNVDYHIGIGFDASLAKQTKSNPPAALKKELQQNSVIVEMTPYYRYLYHSSDWTLESLKGALGKQVRVVGQLMNDSEHDVASQNCALATTAAQRQKCWRYSVWELHPVIRFQVCGEDSCDENSTAWADLGAGTAAATNVNPDTGTPPATKPRGARGGGRGNSNPQP